MDWLFRGGCRTDLDDRLERRPKLGTGRAWRCMPMAVLLVLQAIAASPSWAAQDGTTPAAPAAAPVPDLSSLEPAEALRDLAVTIRGVHFDQADAVEVRLGDSPIARDIPAADDASTIRFKIPSEMPLGAYPVRVVFKRGKDTVAIKTVPIPSQGNRIRVVSDTLEKLKLVGALPLVGYPEKNKFNLTVVGEGFSKVCADNELIIGQGPLPTKEEKAVGMPAGMPVKVAWKEGSCIGGVGGNGVSGEFVSSRQLNFLNIPDSLHSGIVWVRVRVGDAISEPLAVRFAWVTRGTPILAGIVVVVLVSLLVYWPVARTVRRHRVGSTQYGGWKLFLIDPDTDTLSLSKFQLYLWTAVAVFGYTFLTVAQSLIQGVFEFADVPQGLPGILTVSAGTTVLSAGINSVRGPKGAGEEQPSFSDLITLGGMVVAERFQFFVWTILGSLAFLFLVVLSNPATIQALPTVPEGFLYLMGVSSAGYLGGKLARKPGPVIDTLVVQRKALQGLVIDVQGRNLSQEAMFSIDDQNVSFNLGSASTQSNDSGSVAKDAVLRVLRRDPDPAQGKDFALQLQLELADLDAWLKTPPSGNNRTSGLQAWIGQTEPPHRFALLNPDGQKAALTFTVKPDPASSVPSDGKTMSSGSRPSGGSSTASTGS